MKRQRVLARALLATTASATLVGAVLAVPQASPLSPVIPVSRVEAVGMTVTDMDRALAFYTTVLPFTKVSDVELSGRDHELLRGVFGGRMRVVRLALGEERLELTEFLTPRGRPFPEDARPNDLTFQHVAIIVSDMDAAYARLRRAGVRHASTGPQTLPAWNRNAAGIRAFYFRDPDGHFLEILQFPPDKGPPRWHRTAPLFLGIDHTAIVVSDTDRSLALYRDLLQMTVAGGSENFDTEQEHLNNVFGARLRITTMRAADGPGIEFLEYLAPSDGRPAPFDLHANDVAHWQTTLRTPRLDGLLQAHASRLFRLVSPGPVSIGGEESGGPGEAALIRDPDGHALLLAARASR